MRRRFDHLNRISQPLSRSTLDVGVCQGMPCVRHMHWPVDVVLDLVGSGTLDEIITEHPELEREDILTKAATRSCPLSSQERTVDDQGTRARPNGPAHSVG